MVPPHTIPTPPTLASQDQLPSNLLSYGRALSQRIQKILRWNLKTLEDVA